MEHLTFCQAADENRDALQYYLMDSN
jgi:hypothetical protein